MSTLSLELPLDFEPGRHIVSSEYTFVKIATIHNYLFPKNVALVGVLTVAGHTVTPQTS